MPNEKRDIASVLRWIDKATEKGVPLRVAIKRASRRFNYQPGVLRDFHRGT